ncbi:MAG: pseudouridine-5'-phosphate glycosidase, partial [Chloroflexota bacterium]|nr:pseudouridine-5'-phosphate glycosidase [Chloroflexota bacterium]
MKIEDLLDVRADVREAMAAGEPVVALESTIISHGFPYPENLRLAQEAEETVRAAGAVPATVGLVEGRIVVGLDAAQIARFARDRTAVKVSRRNLAATLASGRLGATTVAGTMLCARHAGIRVFATGGIGGVHRGAAATMDISADLTELACTPVCVVCAGAKSILDLPLTLEYLETQGVPVIGYGADRFPAFYTPDSGVDVSVRVDSADEVAAVAARHWALGGGGLVVAVPIPAAQALDAAYIEGITEQAVA